MLQELMNNDSETISDDTQPTVDTVSTDKVGEETLVTPESPAPADPAPTAVVAEPKESVPLPIYLDLKHELKDMQREVAALKATTVPPAVDIVPPAAAPVVEEPDPVEIYVKEYVKRAAENGDVVSPLDVPLSAGIIQQRDAWTSRKQTAQASQQADGIRSQAMNQARVKYSDAVLGQGLGFETIIGQGNIFLTDGDRLDIAQAGPGCPEVAYERCYDRLVKSGTPQGIAIAQLGEARRVALEKKNTPAPSLPDVTKSLEPKPKEIPKVEEILERRPIFDSVGIDYGT